MSSASSDTTRPAEVASSPDGRTGHASTDLEQFRIFVEPEVLLLEQRLARTEFGLACSMSAQHRRQVEQIADGVRAKVAEGRRLLSLIDSPAADQSAMARHIDQWDLSQGPVLWWAWRDGQWLGEPAWIGTPLDTDWPAYHTHWTPHPAFPQHPPAAGTAT